MKCALILLPTLIIGALSQRPYYAGRNPVGYPELAATDSLLLQGTQDRFGNVPLSSLSTTDITTNHLPLEVFSDRNLVSQATNAPSEQPFVLVDQGTLLQNVPVQQTYELSANNYISGSASQFNLANQDLGNMQRSQSSENAQTSTTSSRGPVIFPNSNLTPPPSRFINIPNNANQRLTPTQNPIWNAQGGQSQEFNGDYSFEW